MKGQIERAERAGLTHANHAIARSWAQLHAALDAAQSNEERTEIENKFVGIAAANMAVCEEIERSACRS